MPDCICRQMSLLQQSVFRKEFQIMWCRSESCLCCKGKVHSTCRQFLCFLKIWPCFRLYWRIQIWHLFQVLHLKILISHLLLTSLLPVDQFTSCVLSTSTVLVSIPAVNSTAASEVLSSHRFFAQPIRQNDNNIKLIGVNQRFMIQIFVVYLF